MRQKSVQFQRNSGSRNSKSNELFCWQPRIFVLLWKALREAITLSTVMQKGTLAASINLTQSPFNIIGISDYMWCRARTQPQKLQAQVAPVSKHTDNRCPIYILMCFYQVHVMCVDCHTLACFLFHCCENLLLTHLKKMSQVLLKKIPFRLWDKLKCPHEHKGPRRNDTHQTLDPISVQKHVYTHTPPLSL